MYLSDVSEYEERKSTINAVQSTLRSFTATIVPDDPSKINSICGTTLSLVAHSQLIIENLGAKYASFQLSHALRIECLPQKLFSIANAKV